MASICQAAVKISTKGQAFNFYEKGDKILLEDYISSSGKTLKNAYRMCSKKCSDNFCKRHEENDMTFNQFLEENNCNLATEIDMEDGGYFCKIIKKSEIQAKKMKLNEDNDEPPLDIEQIKIQITKEIMDEVIKLKEEFEQKLKLLENKIIIDPSNGKEIFIEEKIEKLEIESNNFETETEEESSSEIENISELETDKEEEQTSKIDIKEENVSGSGSESEEEIELEEISTTDGRVIHVDQLTSNVYDVETGTIVGKLMKVNDTKSYTAPIHKLGDGYIVAEFFTYDEEEYIRDWLTDNVFEFSNDRCTFLKKYTLKINKDNEYTLIKNKSKKKKKKSSN